MPARKPSVLILFSDATLALVYGRRFEREGFAVRVASSIADARKKLAKSLPSAFLIDVAAESLQGFALLEEVRMRPDSVGMPRLVITALGDAESIKRALATGANDYMILGHFAPTEVVRKVHSYLKK